MMASQEMLKRRCRVCLDWIETEECLDLNVSLFDCATDNFPQNTSGKSTTLLELFNECTQLNVLLDDFKNGDQSGWQVCRYLCLICSCELQRAYQFIVKAKESHAALCEQMNRNTLELSVDKSDTENETDLIETLDEDFQQEESSFRNQQSTESSPILQVEQALADIFGFESGEQSEKESPVRSFERLLKKEVAEIDLRIEDAKTKLEENSLCQQINTELEVIESEQHPEQCDDINNYTFDAGSDGEAATSIEVSLLSPNEDGEIDHSSQDMMDFKCELCVEKFNFQRDLILHYEHKHDENDLHYTCNNCDRRFFTKAALNTHFRQIHQKCEYIFKVHQQRHKKNKEFLCSQCPSTFCSNYTLKKHLGIHSKDRNRDIECKQCDRRFYTIEAFRTHQITHQDPNQRETYNCSLCEKTFMRQTNLKLHMQMHRGETIDCPHCGKQFVRRKDLEIHIRFHTGEFPYGCTVCSRRFAIKSHLIAHEKKHRGIKYQCSLCKKQFLNVAGLRQHAFEHTGMPLSCDICQKGFPTKFKVRRHIRSVHNTLFSDSSNFHDTEKYIKQNEKSAADRIAIVEVPAQPQAEDGEIYEMEMLEEETEDLVDFIVERV